MSEGATGDSPGPPRTWHRKPIAVSEGRDGDAIVLCDDGSLWEFGLTTHPAGWTELPPIPGSYREEQLRKDGADRRQSLPLA